jgi:hypothetical protein
MKANPFKYPPHDTSTIEVTHSGVAPHIDQAQDDFRFIAPRHQQEGQLARPPLERVDENPAGSFMIT